MKNSQNCEMFMVPSYLHLLFNLIFSHQNLIITLILQSKKLEYKLGATQLSAHH